MNSTLHTRNETAPVVDRNRFFISKEDGDGAVDHGGVYSLPSLRKIAFYNFPLSL